jgi:hypothetical protein
MVKTMLTMMMRYVCIYEYVCISINIHLIVYIRMYSCIFEYMYTYINVYVYTYMYICMYVNNRNGEDDADYDDEVCIHIYMYRER